MTPRKCDLCKTDNCVKPGHHISDLFGFETNALPVSSLTMKSTASGGKENPSSLREKPAGEQEKGSGFLNASEERGESQETGIDKPRIRNSRILKRIHSVIIEESGNGELADYVVRYLSETKSLWGVWIKSANKWVVSDAGHTFKTERTDTARAVIDKMVTDGASRDDLVVRRLCWQGSEVLASQAPVDAQEEQKKSVGWIRTADRPPTETDAGNVGLLLARDEINNVTVTSYESVVNNDWPYWMPIPPVPDASQTPTLSTKEKDL